MKKIFSIVLTVSMLLTALITFAVPVSADTFNESDANPTITTAADLKSFLESGSNFSGKTVTLANNITLNADTTTEGWYNAGGAVVINLAANNRAWFSGSFNGNGYTIKGLIVKSNGGWHTGCGMFSGANGNAVIENFTLDGFYVCSPNTETDPTYGSAGVAAVVGHAKTSVTIDNVTLKNGIVTCVANGKGGIGTFVGVYDGQNENQKLAITSCTAEDSVTVVAGAGSAAYVGGLIGYVHENYKSHPTTIDLTGSAFKPAGSDSTLAPFGAFLAGGSTGFAWTIKNELTAFSQKIEMYPNGSGSDPRYLDAWNAAVISSRTYGANAYANTFNASDANPVVTTAADLKAFLESNNEFSGKTITLAGDITLNEDTATVGWYDAGGTVKVTPTATYFRGTFNGNGHTIKGLVVKCNVSWAQEAGMFPGARNATIQNFTLDGFYVCNTGTTGNDGTVSYGQCSAGAVVGHAKDNVTIDNVTIKNGTVTCVENGYAGIGSLVGCYDGQNPPQTLAITNCVVEPSVTVVAGAGATAFVGGLIGYVHENFKSHPTTIDMTGSRIQPAGSDSTLPAFGQFRAGGNAGDNKFLWTFVNNTTDYSVPNELTGSVIYTDEFNAYAVESGCYGPSAVSFEGYQEKDSGNAIRLVGLVKTPANLADVSYLGFEVTVGGQTAAAEKTQCTKVYTSILAADDTLNAPEGYCYFTFVISDIDAATTFQIRACATIDGNDSYSTASTFTYTPA